MTSLATPTFEADEAPQTGNDIRAGSVLSWADRVLHLVNLGQLVRAIDLLVFYYSAEDSTDANVEMLPLATLDLPKDRIDRQAIVEPKLREILAASVDYAFSEQRMKNEAAFYQNGATHGIDSTEFFENLVDAFIRASLAIKSFEFLFDNLAERYFEHGIEGIFLDRLKPYILSGQIKSMPVSISQQLIARCAAGKQMREVEDLIWHIDPQSLDVNQAVSLCSKSHLYEALIHVYTRALQDFVGPLVELVSLIAQIVRGRSTSPWHAVESVSNASSAGTSKDDLDALVPGAYTVFSYLADSFVGLAHPSQEPLQTEVALNAKITLYKFLFSSSLQVYPPGSDALVRTTSEGTSIYPYLYLLLLFDAEATLDCMDIAMEDSYLDEDAAAFGTPDRQSVITAFLTILNNPESRRNLSYGDQTFVNIFIARNLPKYSQFVKLEAETMHQILVHLANDADLSTHQDRELAVEYLLSSYSPAYDAALLQLLEDARFFEVLASIYRSQKAWPRLASVYLKNNDSGPEIFSRLSLVLEKAEADDKAQLEVVKAEILASTPQLINEGVTEFASLIEQKMPEAHTAAVQALQEAPLRQMAYLRSLLEPHMDADSTQPLGQASQHVTENLRYMYVALLAQFDPPSVLRYLDNEPSLDRSKIIDICKERGNFEAVVWIQASHGEVAASLQTARSVLESQGESVIRGLLSREYSPITQRALNNVIDVGKAAMQVAGKACTGDLPAEFATAEDIWYGVLSCLIDTVRDITRNLRTMDTNDLSGECTNEIARVSQLVPDAISVLISSTFAETLALPHLVRRLMDNSRESTYADYKGILDSMLDTYRFEGDLLSTSKRLLELDVHGQVAELVKARGTGWRPGRSGLCEACGRSVWTKTNEKERLSNPRLVVQSASEVEVSEKLKLRPRVRRRPSLKGKETDWYEEEAPKTNHGGPSSQSLVVFRGGAVCHAECLEQGGKR